MDLDNNVLSKVSQTERTNTYMWNLKKTMIEWWLPGAGLWGRRGGDQGECLHRRGGDSLGYKLPAYM